MWYGNGVLSTSLVLTGDLDLLVPPENCRLLAKRIPGANLSVVPESEQIFFIEQPETTNGALLEFFAMY